MKVDVKNIAELKGDRAIWIIVFLLSVLSVLVVYSSTGSLAFKNKAGNTEFYMLKHLLILAAGLLLMYGAYRLPYRYYSKMSYIGIILVIPLLIYTIVGGTNLNSANRWITIPFIGLTFQSSDLAKLVIITYLSSQLTRRKDYLSDLKRGFLPVLFPVAMICLLIFPANFSTSALIFGICTVMMFAAGVPFRFLAGTVGIALAGFVVVLLLAGTMPKLLPRATTWVSRIEMHLGMIDDKEKKEAANYQVEQSKIAIASGGITGKMPGNSIQRNFLPHPYSDFIFAIIVEEYGLIISSFVILLYIILFYRGINIAKKAASGFGMLLAFGLSLGLVAQALINMLVAVDLFPVTGQPLPLVSMGGTSIWFALISLGIVQSVSRYSQETEEEQKLEDTPGFIAHPDQSSTNPQTEAQ